MDEFEKWLQKISCESIWADERADDMIYTVLDKYRSMACKMERIPNYIAFGDDEAMNTMSAYKCSVCGATVLDSGNYCSECGRKVVE